MPMRQYEKKTLDVFTSSFVPCVFEYLAEEMKIKHQEKKAIARSARPVDAMCDAE
jgi:hypothetical protein